MNDPVAISPLTQYLRHLEASELAYQYSPQADAAVFFPRVVSPYGDSLEWRISGGLGTIYATTWIPVANGEPYNVALIDMDEGFRILSSVRSLPVDEVRIGQRVRVRIEHPKDENPYPVFEPLENESPAKGSLR
jgi:uncharacterized protein